MYFFFIYLFLLIYVDEMLFIILSRSYVLFAKSLLTQRKRNKLMKLIWYWPLLLLRNNLEMMSY